MDLKKTKTKTKTKNKTHLYAAYETEIYLTYRRKGKDGKRYSEEVETERKQGWITYIIQNRLRTKDSHKR